MRRSIDMEAYFQSLGEINPSFDKGVLKIAYHGKNRNGSSISKEVYEKTISTLYNVPIVVNYIKPKNKIGGHDSHIETVWRDGKKEVSFVNDTSPIGVVPHGTKVFWESVKEKDGTIKEYLCAEVILWKRQEVYNKLSTMKVINHSMEIDIGKSHWEDNVEIIDDFYYTALCLLSDDIEPCFESSRLLFTLDKDEFKKEFSQMIAELRGATNDINWLHWDEAVTKENFNLDEPVLNKPVEHKEGQKVVNREKLEASLLTPKFSLDGTEMNKFALLGNTDTEVYAFNLESKEVESFNFAIIEVEIEKEDEDESEGKEKEENYEIDFGCGKKGDFSLSFGENIANGVAEGIAKLMGITLYEDMFVRIAEREKSFETDVEAFNAEKEAFAVKESEMNAKFEEMQAELETYKKYKVDREKEDADEKVEKTFSEVSKLLSKEELEIWREKRAEFSDTDAFIKEVKSFALDKALENPASVEFRMNVIKEEEAQKKTLTSYWDRARAKSQG